MFQRDGRLRWHQVSIALLPSQLQHTPVHCSHHSHSALYLCCSLHRHRGSRSAISLQHIINKRKRYDPTVAKQKHFYAQAKQYKAYQRVLKREGYTTAQQPQQRGTVHEDEQREQRKKRRREEQSPHEGAVEEQGSERREAEVEEEGNADQGMDRKEGEQRLEASEQDWMGPKRKKKKAKPAVKTAEQVRQETEERQQRIADSRHVRAEKFKRHAQRTSKGQPVSCNDNHNQQSSAIITSTQY